MSIYLFAARRPLQLRRSNNNDFNNNDNNNDYNNDNNNAIITII